LGDLYRAATAQLRDTLALNEVRANGSGIKSGPADVTAWRTADACVRE
jgi:hypothetical protein